MAKVLFRDVLTGTLKHARDLVYLFRVSTENVICPGLSIATKERSTLTRSWGFPFDRIDSKNCCMLQKRKQKTNAWIRCNLVNSPTTKLAYAKSPMSEGELAYVGNFVYLLGKCTIEFE